MAPAVVSHYRLLEPLGEGGMGVVFRAEDELLGRQVAIKLIRTDENTSPEWLARFEREARLASSFKHPHIRTIHELGEHEGQPFIAMELLEGRTVRQLIEPGPLPIQRVLDFTLQVADALDAAHRHGIIHRDIKPANLLVGDDNQVKVLDFGIAKSTTAAVTGTGPSPASAPTMTAGRVEPTASHGALGTAEYMSPEQALGQPLDARTDLYSLGTVMYEMATGRRAFGGSDMALLITRIINGIVVAPRTIDPDIPGDVEAIILKLMALDPDDRYQTAAEVMPALEAALGRFDPDSAPGAESVLARALKRSRRSPLRWGAAAILGAAVFAGITKFAGPSGRAAALTDRDQILIGAFENTTGDPVFDETLAMALKVQLGQSPFLDIVPDQRMREMLRLMGRSSDDRLTHAVAREMCQRLGLKAMLGGSIAALGTSYLLRLEATDCETGETLARQQATSDGHARVLTKLGSMTSKMRTELGESLPSIERFDVPIEQATTPSLTALKAYALGLEERRRGRELESLAFFNQAIELDPEFASAYATLSTVYGSIGEWQRSEEYARLAFMRQNRVSERERLFITYQYHDRVTGDQDKAATTLELWKAAYPRESRPVNALALIHNRVGRYDLAEQEAGEALRRSPGHPFPLSNLAVAFRAMGRYGDAKKVGDEATALGVATSPTRRLLYQVGILLNDGSADAHVASAKGRPREFDLVSAQAQVAAYEGRLRAAAELNTRAVDMAIAQRLRGTASGYAARLAFVEALYREPRETPGHVRAALSLATTDEEGHGTVPRFRAPAALALAGLPDEALPIVTRAERRYPEATFVRTVLGPVTRAAIALRDHAPDTAIEALRASVPTELGTVAGLVPIYLRAEALRLKGRPGEARLEYERVLKHRGVDPFAPVVPLSQLGIARTYAAAGDVAAGRRAYEELFAIWKSADDGFPPLVRARAEYAQLVRVKTTRP